MEMKHSFEFILTIEVNQWPLQDVFREKSVAVKALPTSVKEKEAHWPAEP